MVQRAVVRGAAFAFLRAHDLPRAAIEDSSGSTPPLRLFRHALWSALQHFTRNLPREGRAGGQVAFGADGSTQDPLTAWMRCSTKMPSDVEFPPTLFKQIMGGRELHAMLSWAAPSARKRYLTDVNQWAYFASMRNHTTWLVKTRPNWDEDIGDFVMFESHAMNNSGDTTRGNVPAIRFWNIVSGMCDFAKFGRRCRKVLKGIRIGRKQIESSLID